MSKSYSVWIGNFFFLSSLVLFCVISRYDSARWKFGWCLFLNDCIVFLCVFLFGVPIFFLVEISTVYIEKRYYWSVLNPNMSERTDCLFYSSRQCASNTKIHSSMSDFLCWFFFLLYFTHSIMWVYGILPLYVCVHMNVFVCVICFLVVPVMAAWKSSFYYCYVCVSNSLFWLVLTYEWIWISLNGIALSHQPSNTHFQYSRFKKYPHFFFKHFNSSN